MNKRLLSVPAARDGEGMAEPIGLVEFIGTIPIKEGALQAHGESGFRVLLDIPEAELPAYMRLHLMRGKVIRFTAEATDEIATPRSRKRVKESLSIGSSETDNRATGRAPTVASRRVRRPTD